MVYRWRRTPFSHRFLQMSACVYLNNNRAAIEVAVAAVMQLLSSSQSESQYREIHAHISPCGILPQRMRLMTSPCATALIHSQNTSSSLLQNIMDTEDRLYSYPIVPVSASLAARDRFLSVFRAGP